MQRSLLGIRPRHDPANQHEDEIQIREAAGDNIPHHETPNGHAPSDAAATSTYDSYPAGDLSEGCTPIPQQDTLIANRQKEINYKDSKTEVRAHSEGRVRRRAPLLC